MAGTKARRRSADDDDAPARVSRPKKRAQAEVDETAAPPRKKRKSAEASSLRMKEIADAEEAVSEEEAEAVATKPKFTKLDASKMDSDELVVPEEVVVAPGFRLWESDSKLLAKKGQTLTTTKINKSTMDYSRVLDVHYPEQFTLVPLVVTQGPYQGRHMFMLQPLSGGFRFTDLPPEIRNMIFSYLLEEEKPIVMATAKRVNHPRRPVRLDWSSRNERNAGLDWDPKAGEWKNMPPSALSLLRANKQIFEEAASIVYGNHFKFLKFACLKIFLESIGDMRRFLRHITIGGNGYNRTHATPIFKNLKEAVNLRSFTFGHEDVCRDSWSYGTTTTTTESFVRQIMPVLQSIREKHTKDELKILDVIKINYVNCIDCDSRPDAMTEVCRRSVTSAYWGGMRDGRCNVICKDVVEHCKEIEKKIRRLLARKMSIKDPITEDASALASKPPSRPLTPFTESELGFFDAYGKGFGHSPD